VAESVKLAKKAPAAGLDRFVNAVSRTLAENVHNLPLPDQRASLKQPWLPPLLLPEWLAVRWLQELGQDAAWARAEAANRQPPLTIRVNTALISRKNLAIVLEAEGVVTEPCRYSPFGLNLRELQQSPFSLPSYQKGLWLFQDEAAQLVTMLLQPEPGQLILEIGAGRGGKTTHLAQLLNGHGEIVALDNHLMRLTALRLNLQRMALTRWHGC
jgi:16S rRNA (cytosine967-C5)-methyltransferase